MTSYTCTLTDAQAAALETYMNGHGFRPREVPYARFAGEQEKLSVVLYKSRKLVVQGKGTRDFVEFVLEPQILQEARLGYETVLEPGLLVPRIGVDESGKGDFFGPLCVAAVYVNESVVRAFHEAGIRDSKHISSGRRIAELAEFIRKTPGCVQTTVPIGNEAYNRLFARLRSVNTMLAWGHARALENLLLLQYQMKPPPVRAITDQFASHKQVIGKALLSLGRSFEVIQRHKAESDVAVAAASILARHEFLVRLEKLEKRFEIQLPKGASAAVEAAGKEFVEKHGADKLRQVAKLHFRTACRVQGLPEPPRKPWKSVEK